MEVAESEYSATNEGDLNVNLAFPQSFTTDPILQKKPYILNFIVEHPQVFRARPDQALLKNPPRLALQLAELITIYTTHSKSPSLEFNDYILAGSLPLHWACEIYKYIPTDVVQFMTTSSTPKRLDAVSRVRLSYNFGVYFCMVGDDFYCGSATALAMSTGLASGTLKRQEDRRVSLQETNTLHRRIHAAALTGERVVWAQALEIDDLDLTDLCPEELLHYRILCKLGEQLLSMGTCAHAPYLARMNVSFWSEAPTWRGLCLREAWSEGIRGVQTPEIRNAKRRVAYLSEEQRQINNAKGRKENMTVEQINARNARNRIANKSAEQIEKRNASVRVENLTEEQLARKRARDRLENMTEEQINARIARQRVANMTEEQIERRNDRNRVANMSEEAIQKRNARHRVANMTEEAVERRRLRESKANLTAEQLEARNARHRVDNMSKEAHERKKARERYGNMTEEQVEKRKSRKRVANLTEEQVEKKRDKERIANMSAEAVEKRNANQRVANMSEERLKHKRERDRKYAQLRRDNKKKAALEALSNSDINKSSS